MDHSCSLWNEFTENCGTIQINGNGEILIVGLDEDIDETEIKELKFKFCPYCKKKL